MTMAAAREHDEVGPGQLPGEDVGVLGGDDQVIVAVGDQSILLNRLRSE